jgi:hypothetical protein
MTIKSHSLSTRPCMPAIHDPWCRGHFYCPCCRKTVCGRPSIYNRDGTARRVVCLECGVPYRARPVLGG